MAAEVLAFTKKMRIVRKLEDLLQSIPSLEEDDCQYLQQYALHWKVLDVINELDPK